MSERARQLLNRYKSRKAHHDRLKEELEEASQGRLMLHKFKKHRVAVVSVVLLIVMYVVAIGAEFVAPYPKEYRSKFAYVPPVKVHFTHEGKLSRPYIYELKSTLDLKTFTYVFEEDTSKRHFIEMLVPTEPYRIAGIIPAKHRLFGVRGDAPLFLMGSDQLGRDLLSRIIVASRISLFVGFGGVILSFVLGTVLGGISGYFGGTIDNVIQRIIDFIMSLPQIPLWMALSAAVPKDWTGIQTYLAITLILSLVGWTGLARAVRGKIISLREEDYVTAAKVAGATDFTIIVRHLLPGFMSYLIVNITTAVPGMILGETTLSFLGLGILPPDVSWGSLLQGAQDLTAVSNYPWLLLPGLFVMITVVLFNFVGDGLRDAADPYSR